jgi:hypothetical protein
MIRTGSDYTRTFRTKFFGLVQTIHGHFGQNFSDWFGLYTDFSDKIFRTGSDYTRTFRTNVVM